jgi:alkyl hydroperoxide reductase subunit D
MTIETIRENLPEYAKDLKLNLGNVLATPNMTANQLWGTALASAIATRNPQLIKAIAAEAKNHLSPEAERAAKGAAAIMGMNNIYYRFVHLVSDKEYGKLPANLRMTIIGNSGVDKQDFELWALAVSAINGCGMCLDSHEQILVKHGMGRDVIQNAVRIASTLHAVAVTLEAEDALAD